MKLHAKKCHFFLKKVVWCGRQISVDGITFDPRNLSGLLYMQPPTNGAELQQFVCAAGWMRQCILYRYGIVKEEPSADQVRETSK